MPDDPSQQRKPNLPQFIPDEIRIGLEGDARRTVVLATLDRQLRSGERRAFRARRLRDLVSPTSDPHALVAAFLALSAPVLWLGFHPFGAFWLVLALVVCAGAIVDILSGVVLLGARNPDRVKSLLNELFSSSSEPGRRPVGKLGS